MKAFFASFRNRIAWYFRANWAVFCDYLWVSWAYFQGQIFLQEKYWPSNIRRLLKKKPVRRVRILMCWWGMHDTVFEAHLADRRRSRTSKLGLVLVLTDALCAQSEYGAQMSSTTSGLPGISLPVGYGRMVRLLNNGCPSSPIPDKLRQREWRNEKWKQRSSKQQLR